MSRETWVITGVSGFLGKHVVDLLDTCRPVRKIGVGRSIPPNMAKLDRFVITDSGGSIATDWATIVTLLKPDVILHIAGATPPASPEVMFRTNVEMTIAIVVAAQRSTKPVRLVHVGSAAELGDVPRSRMPAHEACPAQPVSEYGSTKLAATLAVLAADPPVCPIVARLFNPIGPGQSPNQVFSQYAHQMARSSIDEMRVFHVPGIGNRRDFIDVRDAASAIVTLAVEGRCGQIYHVGTGVSRSIREGLETLARISGREVTFESDRDRSASGPVDSIADPRKILRNTSWRRRFTFEQSLRDLWSEFENRPGKASGDSPT